MLCCIVLWCCGVLHCVVVCCIVWCCVVLLCVCVCPIQRYHLAIALLTLSCRVVIIHSHTWSRGTTIGKHHANTLCRDGAFVLIVGRWGSELNLTHTSTHVHTHAHTFTHIDGHPHTHTPTHPRTVVPHILLTPTSYVGPIP